MQASDPSARRSAPRRMARRLVSTASVLTLAALPTGVARAALPAADPPPLVLATVNPTESTLSQFDSVEFSGSGLPPGRGNVRVRGVFVGTVQVDSSGNFGPADFTVPFTAVACGQDAVTLDEGGPILDGEPVTVFCPTLTADPNPIFSAGVSATSIAFTVNGFEAQRDVAMTLDGQSVGTVNTGTSGVATGTVPNAALACGQHVLTATLQPPSGVVLFARRAAVRPLAATFPDPAVSTTMLVLGCPNSQPAPDIFADPIETGIDQFTQFSVSGDELAAGPATIRFRGIAVGTVTVGTDGTFPSTDFTVPAGAAACGQDAVTVDDVTPAIAQTEIAVFCPKLTAAPNPVFSGGAAADVTLTGTGYPGDRDVDFTLDGRDLGTVTSARDGSVTKAVTGTALACGTHQAVGTAQPQPEEGFEAKPLAARATVPFDPPIPAAAQILVLGCANSTPPPQLSVTPVETTLDEFARFTVSGSQLPTGTGTIKLAGVKAGTVQVGAQGTFPSTDFTVPDGAASCGKDPVTIDNGGPVLATAVVSVFCPVITVTPNPVDSGGNPATMTLSGTGFPPNRPINLGFDGQTRATVASGATGAVQGTISGVSPACGQHQATATAQPPLSSGVGAAAGSANAVAAFLPVSAFTTVVVVGCARIDADPGVVQQGMLTHVTGSGFLPRTALTLAWQSLGGAAVFPCSPDAIRIPALTTDAGGDIDVFCLAYPYETIGALQISAAQPPETETTPVVIEDGPMQPSNGSNQFVFRR
ncbi:MAG TPA: hypothetical protein VFU73_11635 [Actinocrinis sp.]|nr:hypothetical protein [Actinocrinis sp.]